MQRCGWVSQDPLYIQYHDNEWGVAQRDARKLFEMICLEGQQAMEESGESFSDFVWSFVENQPQISHAATLAEIPTTTPASDALSKALKKRGFKFVGSTICYSFMQACGLVNDHLTSCFCHPGGDDDPQVGR